LAFVATTATFVCAPTTKAIAKKIKMKPKLFMFAAILQFSPKFVKPKTRPFAAR
jgi:hypothetical protein